MELIDYVIINDNEFQSLCKFVEKTPHQKVHQLGFRFFEKIHGGILEFSKEPFAYVVATDIYAVEKTYVVDFRENERINKNQAYKEERYVAVKEELYEEVLYWLERDGELEFWEDVKDKSIAGSTSKGTDYPCLIVRKIDDCPFYEIHSKEWERFMKYSNKISNLINEKRILSFRNNK